MLKKLPVFLVVHKNVTLTFKSNFKDVVYLNSNNSTLKKDLTTIDLSEDKKHHVSFTYNGISLNISGEKSDDYERYFIPYESMIRVTNKNETSEIDILSLKK